jgi:hypothetical protein
VDFIVGTRAVVSNPHYKHFFSPIETDSSLGAVTDWPLHGQCTGPKRTKF